MTHLIDRRRLLLAGAAATLPIAARAQSRESVTLQIDGAAVPYYAPIYVGLENGYFAERGLDLRVIYAAAADIMRNVAANNVQFGFPNADAVIAAKASGLPVKVIHTTYQRGIGATLFKASKGYKTMADLKGQRVAVTALGSPNYLQLQVGLKKAGLALSDVKLEVIATGAIVQALEADQVDAIVFSELRKYNIEADGFPAGLISSNDFLPSFGNVVVTSDALLKSKPAVAKDFVAALDKSLQWIIDGHVDAAIKLSIDKYAPTWAGQEALLKTTLEGSFIPSIWQSALTRQSGLGEADLSAWQQNIDILADNKVIDTGFKAGDLVIQPNRIGA